MYYGAGASETDHWVDTSVLIRNQDPNATTFFMLQPNSNVYNNGSVANGTGWYLRLRLFNSNGTLHTDLGFLTDDTAVGHLYLNPFEVYSLQSSVHVPQGLTVGYEYSSSITVGGRPDFDPEEPGATSVTSFNFRTYINPTLAYYISGRVYQPDSWEPAPSSKITLTNVRSGESVSLTADGQGRYSFDLMSLPSGYMDNDEIRVRATSGSLGGSNSTYVNIVTTPVLGEYGRDCDIFLLEEEEEESFWDLLALWFLNLFTWILIIIIVILVILIVVYRQRTRGRGTTAHEKELEADLSATQKEVKELKRKISRKDAEMGKKKMTWAQVKPDEAEEEPEVKAKPIGKPVKKPSAKKAPVKKRAPAKSPAKKKRTPPVAPAAVATKKKKKKRKVVEEPEEEVDFQDELGKEIDFEVPDWLEKKITPEAEAPAKDIEDQPWLVPDEAEPDEAVVDGTGFEVPDWLEKEMATIPEEKASKDVGFESQPWLEPEDDIEPEELIGGVAGPDDLGLDPDLEEPVDELPDMPYEGPPEDEPAEMPEPPEEAPIEEPSIPEEPPMDIPEEPADVAPPESETEPGFDDLLGDLDEIGLEDDSHIVEHDLDVEDTGPEIEPVPSVDDELGPLIVEEAPPDLDLGDLDTDELDVEPEEPEADVDSEFQEKAKDIEKLLDQLD